MWNLRHVSGDLRVFLEDHREFQVVPWVSRAFQVSGTFHEVSGGSREIPGDLRVVLGGAMESQGRLRTQRCSRGFL